jgi:hypothetical protein
MAYASQQILTLRDLSCCLYKMAPKRSHLLALGTARGAAHQWWDWQIVSLPPESLAALPYGPSNIAHQSPGLLLLAYARYGKTTSFIKE